MKRGLLSVFWGTLLLAAFASSCSAQAPSLSTALHDESSYICDCSYSIYCTNNSGISTSSDAYGELNDDRINNAGGGPDYCRPAESAMGAIGLIAAEPYLSSTDQTRANNVLHAFFWNWVLKGQEQASSGEIYTSISYSSSGAFSSASSPTPSATGHLLSAMWKYYKYTNDSTWLQNATAWSIVQKAANFLVSNSSSKYNLEISGGNYWTVDSAYAVPGLQCAVAWAQAMGQPSSVYSSWQTTASSLQQGLTSMEDPTWHVFYRYLNGQGKKTYGNPAVVDNTCFSPYETNALTVNGATFASSVSDSFTYGYGGSPDMTPYNDKNSTTSAWQYFGTYLASNSSHLSPGGGLELAKVEWKQGSTALANRAALRYQWAYGTAYSDLWFGATGQTESGVANGILDWRDATSYSSTPATWQRFIDTSAYFIEVSLMLDSGVDTTYTP